MTIRARFALPFALLLLPLPAAAGTAQVTFADPETFTDASLHRGDAREQARNLAELERHLVRLAERLPEGQHLAVKILDVDLAGRHEPQLSPYDIRVMRSITPPRITLHYVLTEGDNVLQSDEAKLQDQAYLQRSATVSSSDPLRYDKRLLSDWFRKTFESEG